MNIKKKENKKEKRVIFSLTNEELEYLNDIAVESRMDNRSEYIRSVLFRDMKKTDLKK